MAALRPITRIVSARALVAPACAARAVGAPALALVPVGRARTFAAAGSAIVLLDESKSSLRDVIDRPGSKVIAYFTATCVRGAFTREVPSIRNRAGAAMCT